MTAPKIGTLAFFFFLFAHPSYYLRSFYFLFPSSLDVTQIQGYQERLFFPLPHYGTCLLFYRLKTSAMSCLVGSHRIDFFPLKLPTASVEHHLYCAQVGDKYEYPAARVASTALYDKPVVLGSSSRIHKLFWLRFGSRSQQQRW